MASEPDDAGEEIVVVAKRKKGNDSSPSPNVFISISIGGGDFNDIFPVELRAIFVDKSDFDVDPLFTAKEREIIVKAIRAIASHPKFAAKFATLAEKGADINVRLVTQQGQLPSDARAGIEGLNSDKTVAQGAKITIWLRREFGSATSSNFQFAVDAVHELLHALGDPQLTAELHSSDLDRIYTIDLFRGYDFNAVVSMNDANSALQLAEPSGGMLAGGSGFEVFSGSNRADVVVPSTGGSVIYTGSGDDEVQVTAGGGVDVIREESGIDTITIPNEIVASRVSARWSQDGSDLIILIDEQPEVIIENATGSGAVERVIVGGQAMSIAALQTAIDIPLADDQRHAEFFGAFAGGMLASASQSDTEGAAVTYRLASVAGAYEEEPWTVDPTTGAIHGHFAKTDKPGSEFTFITVIASDVISSARILVTLRWARQGEVNPEL